MMLVYPQGTRVNTPLGTGAVVYVRMAGPTYSQPQAYSVKLDCYATDPEHRGTVFAAKDVIAV